MNAERPERPERPDDPPDRLLVYGLSDEGRTAHVLRQRGDEVEAGRLRPVESGQALTGELVALRRRPEFPLLFDVDVKVESPLQPKKRTDRAGPVRIASEAYRRGWDAVWGRAPERPDGGGDAHGEPDDDALPQ
jgi:hypothetical protein